MDYIPLKYIGLITYAGATSGGNLENLSEDAKRFMTT